MTGPNFVEWNKGRGKHKKSSLFPPVYMQFMLLEMAQYSK